MNDIKPQVLLTGVTGYIGGRLLHALKAEGYPVRCLVRHKCDAAGVECMSGDVLDKPSLKLALKGVHTAFYFVHTIGSQSDSEDLDRTLASNFGLAAAACGVKKLIYLGGLGDSFTRPSNYLKRRQEVGHVLRNSAQGVQVIELRASMVVGSGSLSFEMIRSLAEGFPLQMAPRWFWIRSQPISVEDLIRYLIEAMRVSIDGNPIFEIGGRDKVSYADLFHEYARQRGLKRLLIRVPFESPRLSSWWISLATPLYARVSKKLSESALSATVVHDPLALRLFKIEPMGLSKTVQRALINEGNEFAPTRWFDSLSSCLQKPDWEGVRLGSSFVYLKELSIDAPPQESFIPIQSIGGERGWYYGDFMWRIRGFLDLLIGGVGFRRGRRHPLKLRIGDVIDCWRVEAIEPNRRLNLISEMKLPGRAWLEFTVHGDAKTSTIRQKMIFEPMGFWGTIYWHLFYPLRRFMLWRMLQGIANEVIKQKEMTRDLVVSREEKKV